MSPFAIRHIDSLTAEELEIAVNLTVKAYDDMLVARAMVGDDKNLMDPLFRSMIRAANLAGTIDLACDVSNSNKIVGMAVWFGPGKSLFADAEQRELGLNEFMGKLSPETRQWWGETYGPKTSELVKTALGPTGALDSWWTPHIAVDEKYRQRGIGTMLLDESHKRAVQSGTITALVTTTDLNESIYEKVGFVTKGRMSVDSPQGPIAFRVMSRS
ncbi:uncharacterized protein EV420DRAFT_1640471 [Desarmillaria tabescens]|uniref:N-acetyltransferase domain-containing protein n=1 Tax=Armillaria tabescens TaxID=1929756 RepID=A0AA39N8G4_ARMTA|nr:uncharacterized protein EV420DRAFT_1640471 [Desarmillaria tabescens]KAK0460966.1 hypothetical protein EV420DRAFT_1640471 [Desarmillaria tabescens]